MKKMNVSPFRLATLSMYAGIALFFTSCSSDDESAGANISPKEAVINYASNENCQMVMSVRLGDLIEKSGLRSDLLPQEMKMMADGYLAQFLDKEENGLDLDQTAFILGDFTGIPNPPKFAGVIMAISDAETFSAFVEGQTRMQPEEGDGFKFISLGENGVIVWNSGMAAVFGGSDFMGGGASEALDGIMKSMSEKGKKNTKELAKFVDKKADMGFYMDFENYIKVIPTDDVSGAVLKSDFYKALMKDSYFTGYVNFEAGKITAEYDMAGNKQFEKMMKTAYNNGNPEFANYLGGENLIGFMTGSMNIDALLDSYEKMGFFDSPEVASGLDKIKLTTGLSVRDIADKFSGEFSIAFVGIQEDESEAAEAENNPYGGYSEYRKSTKPVLTFAIGIRDSLMAKIFDTIPALTKKKNYYSFPEGGLCMKKGVLFITSAQPLLEDFALDGRLNSYTKNNAQKSIGENPLYGYFSFDALKEALMGINPEVAEAIAKLDYAEMMATKDAKFKAVLYFKDKKTNALKSLGKLIIDSASKSGMML